MVVKITWCYYCWYNLLTSWQVFALIIGLIILALGCMRAAGNLAVILPFARSLFTLAMCRYKWRGCSELMTSLLHSCIFIFVFVYIFHAVFLLISVWVSTRGNTSSTSSAVNRTIASLHFFKGMVDDVFGVPLIC